MFTVAVFYLSRDLSEYSFIYLFFLVCFCYIFFISHGLYCLQDISTLCCWLLSFMLEALFRCLGILDYVLIFKYS